MGSDNHESGKEVENTEYYRSDPRFPDGIPLWIFKFPEMCAMASHPMKHQNNTADA